MLKQNTEIFYSIIFGFLLGSIGVFLMGYVAAVHIPEEYILWFGNNHLALFTINFFSQFLSFGIIALFLGLILGRLSKNWLLSILLCYLAFMLYMSAGTALVYGGEISNPFQGLSLYDLPVILIPPICLFLSTYFSARKL